LSGSTTLNKIVILYVINVIPGINAAVPSSLLFAGPFPLDRLKKYEWDGKEIPCVPEMMEWSVSFWIMVDSSKSSHAQSESEGESQSEWQHVFEWADSVGADPCPSLLLRYGDDVHVDHMRSLKWKLKSKDGAINEFIVADMCLPPRGEWFHVALSVFRRKVTCFVNGRDVSLKWDVLKEDPLFEPEHPFFIGPRDAPRSSHGGIHLKDFLVFPSALKMNTLEEELRRQIPCKSQV
jgi:hypothetical protein